MLVIHHGDFFLFQEGVHKNFAQFLFLLDHNEKLVISITHIIGDVITNPFFYQHIDSPTSILTDFK